jgi:hypothetical protein
LRNPLTCADAVGQNAPLGERSPGPLKPTGTPGGNLELRAVYGGNCKRNKASTDRLAAGCGCAGVF